MPNDMSPEFPKSINSDFGPDLQQPKPSGLKKPYEMNPPGGPTGPSNPLETADPEQQRRMMESMFGMMFGAEARGYTELAAKTNPQEVRHANRMLMGITERQNFEHAQRPTSYVFDNITQSLRVRAEELEITFPLGLGNYSRADREAGLDKDENEQKRITLAGVYRKSADEMQARLALMEKVAEQDIFSGDIDQYAIESFVRLGKQIIDSKYYGIILNMEETYAGFEKYGAKVEKAIDLWKNVAEGRATIDIVVQKQDGTQTTETRRLPNPFAMPLNSGLMNKIIQYYITPQIKSSYNYSQEESGAKKRAIQKLEWADNYAAAITALNLVDHWDLDVEWGVGVTGYSDMLTEADIDRLELSWNDVGKLFQPELRRKSEYYGLQKTKRREHPRAAGAPATFGCYPRLATDMLSVVTVEIQATRTDTGKTEKIPVSIDDAVWSQNNGVGKIKRLENGKLVEWEFAPLTLKNIPWDDIRIFHGSGEVKQITYSQHTGNGTEPMLDYGLGVASNAFEVPYKLQGMYAAKAIFSEVTRTDYLNQYKEIAESDKLQKLNKGITTALGILSTAYNLDSSCTQKLENYIRVVFLGGIAASVIKFGTHGTNAGPTLEQQQQVNTKFAQDKPMVLTALVGSARTARFLTFVENKNTVDLDPQEKKLLEYIVDHRKAPTPFELKKAGIEWFTEDELTQLKPLYPLS